MRLNHDFGSREFALLRWGLVPFWAKDAKLGFSTFNARSEEASKKPAFSKALKARRCLVPADAFYEWKRIELMRRPNSPTPSRSKAASLASSPDCGSVGSPGKARLWRPSPF